MAAEEDYSKSYSMDAVREAFQVQENQKRKDFRATNGYGVGVDYPYRYVKEVWTDFVLVCDETGSYRNGLVKIPYTVDDKGNVTFDKEVAVRAEYVEMSATRLWIDPHGPQVHRLARLLEESK